jgi:hypothetical protein
MLHLGLVEGVHLGTRGNIPDISPRGCRGLTESRTSFTKKYTNISYSY